MTRKEMIPQLQAKGDEIVAWFVGKILPVSPWQSQQAHIVIDVKKFFQGQIKRMEAQRDDPFNRLYVNAYKELERLKIYMEAPNA